MVVIVVALVLVFVSVVVPVIVTLEDRAGYDDELGLIWRGTDLSCDQRAGIGGGTTPKVAGECLFKMFESLLDEAGISHRNESFLRVPVLALIMIDTAIAIMTIAIRGGRRAHTKAIVV